MRSHLLEENIYRIRAPARKRNSILLYPSSSPFSREITFRRRGGSRQ